MCQNKIIDYNIQVKSKYAELFLLKKENFLKISITFKEIIQQFLHNSLINHLLFLEQKEELEEKIREKMTIRNKSLMDYETIVEMNNSKNDAEIDKLASLNPQRSIVFTKEQLIDKEDVEADLQQRQNSNNNKEVDSVLDNNMSKLLTAVRNNNFLFTEIKEQISKLVKAYSSTANDYAKRNIFEELQELIRKHLEDFKDENEE